MFGKTYAPSPFVCVSRAARVATFVALTVAPGTSAPSGSFTTPRSVAAPGCCARTPAHNNTAAQTATARRAKSFLIGFCLLTDGLDGKAFGKLDAVLVHKSDALSWDLSWARESNYSLTVTWFKIPAHVQNQRHRPRRRARERSEGTRLNSSHA